MVGEFSDPSAPAPSLLLVEDDAKLGELVCRFLQQHQFTVHWAKDAAEAIKLSQHHLFDLIICDVMLPDDHGFNLFTTLRRDSNIPLLFLTALSDDQSHIEGLDLGAVDYLIKPVEPDVLLARIRAQLRISKRRVEQRTVRVDDLLVDASHRTAHNAGTLIDLSRQEFDLLWLFVQYPNTILARDVLYDVLTEREYDGKDRVVDGRVSRLRKKLETAPNNQWTIRNIWGRGYLFCRRDAAHPE